MLPVERLIQILHVVHLIMFSPTRLYAVGSKKFIYETNNKADVGAGQLHPAAVQEHSHYTSQSYMSRSSSHKIMMTAGLR